MHRIRTVIDGTA